MDRRVFDMLELYKQNNADNSTAKVCFNGDYCLDTDYNGKNGDILTMAFVNMQPIESVYETEQGFNNGTIFPNIDKPFWRASKI